jgi:hypothetical protein
VAVFLASDARGISGETIHVLETDLLIIAHPLTCTGFRAYHRLVAETGVCLR